METLVPPINSKGVFTLLPPFDTLVDNNQELEVISVRNIKELRDSGELPFESIYDKTGMTKDTYNEDVKKNIPIVVFVTTGGKYIYIPANKIKQIPNISGVRYQEKIIAVPLGNIPTTMNLETAKQIIEDDIYESLGIQTKTDVINASAVSVISQEKDKEFKLKLENRKTVKKSYKTRYLELKNKIGNLTNKISKLENYILTGDANKDCGTV